MDKKTKILIVDDTELNRSILSDILSPDYEILEASNGAEAVTKIGHYYGHLSLVLLDIVMPEMDGFGVLDVMNKNGWLENLPVIMISAEMSSGYIDRAYDLGVTDYITRPFDERTVLRRVQNTIVLYTKQKMLENMVTEQIMEKERNNSQMVEILSNIVEFRNGESGYHVLHVRIFTDTLLQALSRTHPEYGLTASRIALIANASAMHDIGKICIDDKILNKPGRLTNEEFEIMKTHAAIGAEMLGRVPISGGNELIKVAIEICHWHHERYDGRGYPDGLKGEEIPISAQVVALADVYDALTSQRVYKPAFTHEKAVEMITNGECGCFSPTLMECLRENCDKLLRAMQVQSSREVSSGEMQRVAVELMSRSELRISNRTLTLLEQERAKYQFYASMTHEILFEYDCGTDILEFSERGAEQLNIPSIINQPGKSKDIARGGGNIFEEIWEKLEKTTPEEPVISERRCLTIHGQPRWFNVVARTLWEDGDPPVFTRVIGKLVDIHESQLKIHQLQELAKQDTLTGLYNHGGTQEMVETALAERGDQKCLMIMMDLDYLKRINDTHGHIFGDSILKFMADRIRMSIRKDDIAGRIGGDEFMIFMNYKGNPRPLVERVFENVCVEHERHLISVSMGVAVCPEYGETYEELYRRADLALYAAKKDGKGKFCFYNASLADVLSERTPTPIDSSEER